MTIVHQTSLSAGRKVGLCNARVMVTEF
jgi:hypothetical protein